jgi:hypothetical protein
MCLTCMTCFVHGRELQRGQQTCFHAVQHSISDPPTHPTRFTACHLGCRAARQTTELRRSCWARPPLNPWRWRWGLTRQ